jgi:hypothetical protein
MWLPKDERRLLAGYYRKIGKASGEEVYAYDQLSGLLSDRSAKIRSYDEPSDGSSDTNGGLEGFNLHDRKKEITTYVEDLIDMTFRVGYARRKVISIWSTGSSYLVNGVAWHPTEIGS